MGKVSHKEKSLEQRLKESTQIREKYPDRICIYIEKNKSCKTLFDLDKNKYLVPDTITVAQIMSVIRSRISIPKESALFFYINNHIISGNTSIITHYKNYKDPDGFLYIKYSGENAFG
jgi:GABA(A) receptor-associated protein